MRQHCDHMTGAWKQISKHRRRVDVSYDPSTSMVMAVRHGTWIDGERFIKTCIRKMEERGGIHQPFYGMSYVRLRMDRDVGHGTLGCSSHN